MRGCRTYTTYEALEEMSQAYAAQKMPSLRLRSKHAALWLLAWSASLPRSPPRALPETVFRHASIDEFLVTLSTWRHVEVDADLVLRAVAHAVHGPDEPLPRDRWERLLRTAERLWVSMAAPEATWLLHAPPAPMRCLEPHRLRLALEAPDVRKAALELYYRRERRCHEHCAVGNEAALVQRGRMAHVLAADRREVLHAPLADMHPGARDIVLVAHVHCVLLGQQRLDFARRAVRFEAELDVNALHASAVPVIAHRRSGWSVLWRGSATKPARDARYALNSWRALVVEHGLNPIDGRHDVATL